MNVLYLQLAINALIIGLLYGLVGLTLSLLFGVMRVVNLAHGELLILGAFVSYFFANYLDVNPLLAVPLAIAVGSMLGCVVYLVIVKRLQKAEDREMSSFLAFFGLSLVLTAIFLRLFDADIRILDFSFTPVSFKFGPVLIPTARVVAIAYEAVVLIGLMYLLYRTFPGKALRAAMMNRAAVQTVGIDIDRLSLICFSGAFGLTCATGVLMTLVFPAFGPMGGLEYTILGFIVIVLGGVDNPVGAILGGIVYGLTQQLIAFVFSEEAGLMSGFIILTVVILFRPQGLLGSRQHM
ncbi:MAG: branched-chain amino acid ABC transporter permease [Rhizobiaceae bacterium]|nr:branched-chain amino acid ABC transporter permease [Rhizobiaceae bacterium]